MIQEKEIFYPSEQDRAVTDVIKILLFILSKNSIDTLSGLSIQDRMCHRFSGRHIVSPVKFSVNSLG